MPCFYNEFYLFCYINVYSYLDSYYCLSMNIKQYFNRVTRTAKQLRGLFPSPLPTGVSEFNDWADEIASTYRLPTYDQDSIRFSLATQIMHLGPTAASKPKYFFVLAIRAGAAKQIAGNAFHEIKVKHEAARKAALAAEATAISVGSDAPQVKGV